METETHGTPLVFRPSSWAVIAIASILGCGHVRPPAEQSLAELSGQPSWLPLGGEVYYENDWPEGEKHVLVLRSEPRWFLGYSKPATTQEYEANQRHLREQGMFFQTAETFGGHHYLPTTPLYPNTLNDLPIEDQNVRLSLGASALDGPQGVVLKLSLTSSGNRSIWREVQHRWTNTVPFLFAIFVDGKAVKLPQGQWGKEGGVSQQIVLVEAGGQRDWLLKVDSQSIHKLLHNDMPHEISIVAVFSERQHEGFMGEDVVGELGMACSPPSRDAERQLVVRSNVAKIKWTGTRWVTFDPIDQRPTLQAVIP